MTELTVSRQSLFRNDEDYSDCVCLLLPKGHATLIDAEHFESLTDTKWQVMGRTIFYVERFPVTYTRRYCGAKYGYGTYRHPATTIMHSFTHSVFGLGLPKDSIARHNALIRIRGKDIDHVNRNPWDNRLANLRPATRSQNLQNTGPRRVGNKSSKYKGVSKLKGKERWIAYVTVRGKSHYLGSFDDEFKAAQAYNAAVRRLCPDFGYINPLSSEGTD